MCEQQQDVPQTGKMSKEKKFEINLSLLPIKAHYFFFYGAMGGVMPFMQVLAKNLGISSSAVGIVYAVVPFCAFFSKPVFGFITDFFRNIKVIVLLLVCVTSVGYFLVIFLPYIDRWIRVHAQCQEFEHSILVLPHAYKKKCVIDVLKQSVDAELKVIPCDTNIPRILHGKINIKEFPNSTDAESNDTFWLKFTPDSNFSSECIENGSSELKCATLNPCLLEDDYAVYQTYQYWVFAILVVIGGTGSTTVFTLSDAACYEVLGDRPELFGRQRLFATVSWGCVSLIAGFLNDIVSKRSNSTTFAPGFYFMLALVAVDILLLWKIKLTKASFSLNICRDIGQIFSSCHTVAFAACVYIIGGLTGLIWFYLFWFLEDLGATQTLMGLCVAVQCLVAEMPFFFFAGWFIKTFGYFTCIIGSFMAFTLRLGLYYILENPWLVLPIETLHGFTFAIFYASMTGYASSNAPPGTEATMMGILGGLFEGLGVATGSLLGGFGFRQIGAQRTFLVGATISFICVPSLALTLFILKMLRPKS